MVEFRSFIEKEDIDKGFLSVLQDDKGDPLAGMQVTYGQLYLAVILKTYGGFKTSDAIEALKGRFGHPDDLPAIRQNLYTIAKSLRNPQVAQKDPIDMTTEDLKAIDKLLKTNAENDKLDVNARVGAAWLLGGLKEASKDLVWQTVGAKKKSDNSYYNSATDYKPGAAQILGELKDAALKAENPKPAATTTAAGGGGGGGGSGGRQTKNSQTSEGAKMTTKPTALPSDPKVEFIQTVLNLLDKRLDPHWVDGIYGQSTNAAFKQYLDVYGDKHAVPEAIKTGHVPNKDGKLQKPADPNWLVQVNDFYKSKIETDVLFRMTLRESAIGILKKHGDQTGPARPDADDQKSALTIAKLFGVTDTDPKKIIEALEKGLTEDKAKWDVDPKNRDAQAAKESDDKNAEIRQEVRKKFVENKKLQENLTTANQEILKGKIDLAIGRYDLAEQTRKAEEANRLATIHKNREHVGDAWAHTAKTLDYLRPDDKSKELGKQYCKMFEETVQNKHLADPKQGFLHIDDKGHVIYVRGELVKAQGGKESFVVHATDISKHMTDKKLVGLETLPVSAENRAEMGRVYTMNKNVYGGGFDNEIGVVKKMNADINNRRDKEYFIHAHKNDEGEFVVSVVPERVRGQNAALYARAFEQTQWASWEKSSNLDNTENRDATRLIRKKGYDFETIKGLQNAFTDAAADKILNGGPKSTATAPVTFKDSAEAIKFLNEKLGMTEATPKIVDKILKQTLDKVFGSGGDAAKQTELAPALKFLRDQKDGAFDQIIGVKPLDADPAAAPPPGIYNNRPSATTRP